jgi:hypothetical protein
MAITSKNRELDGLATRTQPNDNNNKRNKPKRSLVCSLQKFRS